MGKLNWSAVAIGTLEVRKGSNVDHFLVAG